MSRPCPTCGGELVRIEPAKVQCRACGKAFSVKPKGEATPPRAQPAAEKPTTSRTAARAAPAEAPPKPATARTASPGARIVPGPRPAAAAPEHAGDAASEIAAFQRDFRAAVAEVGKMIVGMTDVVESTMIALIAGGNVLLEGVPGLGKTMLVRAISQALQIRFRRVQFTPDLMPADIVGTTMVGEEDGRRTLQFQPGPVFTNLLLADEINRATPRTQSALLEAMEEHSVTVGGTTRRLDEPFFVLATQNPVEQAGTYPLPAAQLDKFMFKLLVDYPTFAELESIVERTTSDKPPEVEAITTGEDILRMRALVRRVPVAAHVEGYAARLVLASDPASPYATDLVRANVRQGASPRGVLALVLGAKIRALLEGRFAVGCGDIRRVAPAALRHRLARSVDGEADDVGADAIVADLLAKVPEFEEAARSA